MRLGGSEGVGRVEKGEVRERERERERETYSSSILTEEQLHASSRAEQRS